ncbi:TetR/AcrR family transcriptional regulator [Rhodococcus sp. BP22]|uniref:TetR/AcrR family transcriptional regulator n=1 Tax=Rhodococcus sp. BP22 TaxID=2758566 RepID=UPI0028F6E812|nr:TetR/AcrR family transcriptional regulator [Rhodococcus sp. BP22]
MDAGGDLTPESTKRSTPIWDRVPPRLRRSPGLSRDRIVRAAIVLVDREGLDNMAMRDIAGVLGSSPMSLYRHVPSKEDLIDLMVDAIVAEQDLDGIPSGDWRNDLERLARTNREMLLAHPWASRPPVRPLLGPEALRRLETALAIFPRSVPVTARAWAVNTVDAFVRGSVGADLAERFEIERTGLDKAEWQQVVAPYMSKILDSGNFPHVQAYLHGENTDPGAQFDAGLSAVLSGIVNQFTDEHLR